MAMDQTEDTSKIEASKNPSRVRFAETYLIELHDRSWADSACFGRHTI